MSSKARRWDSGESLAAPVVETLLDNARADFAAFRAITVDESRILAAPNWQFAIGLGFVSPKTCRVDAKRPNIDRAWSISANATIRCNHPDARSKIFRVHRSGNAAPVYLASGDVHIRAGAEQQAGHNSDESFHNFFARCLLLAEHDSARDHFDATIVPSRSENHSSISLEFPQLRARSTSVRMMK